MLTDHEWQQELQARQSAEQTEPNQLDPEFMREQDRATLPYSDMDDMDFFEWRLADVLSPEQLNQRLTLLSSLADKSNLAAGG